MKKREKKRQINYEFGPQNFNCLNKPSKQSKPKKRGKTFSH